MSLAALEAEVVECRRCPRLVAWREQVAAEKRAAFRDETYWGRPVRFAPCAAGASPSRSTVAAGSPKPGPGRPQ